ncbi:hypothetical protein [Afifella sp. YEN Y35]|uniref:hypothetical protein n=1 Tax=Afifella sp. YEN Y35 TaxID=3388337 RepID=UPI0039DF9A78
MKKTRNAKAKPRHSWLPTGLASLMFVAGIAIYAYPSLNAAGSASPAIPEGQTISSWAENGEGGRYLLEIVDGRAPATAVAGKVLSDANCEPDALGLNHCHNEIALPDGSTITVINNHQMSAHRCLSPGETLQVEKLDSGWVVGTLS